MVCFFFLFYKKLFELLLRSENSNQPLPAEGPAAFVSASLVFEYQSTSIDVH